MGVLSLLTEKQIKKSRKKSDFHKSMVTKIN